jgi:probable O-glycosylation ligase (exosortase A-associated)
MRDYFFLLVVPFIVYTMLKRPFIGLGMWVWTAMFYPNIWVYGIASNIRYNLLFSIVAIISYAAMRDKPKVKFDGITFLVVLFLIWTVFSSLGTQALPTTTWDIWIRFAKVVLLFVFIIFILEKKLHVDFLLWAVVLSIGFYGALEALKFIASGGGHKIEGHEGHVLGDRNELACAIVMTLPICYYLVLEYGRQSKILRIALLGVMALLVTAVIGTQSRGGLVALIGLSAYMFVKSDRKGLLTTLAVLLALGLSGLVSEEWISRMDTISSADEDASFMGRIVAWKLSFILAVQNPIFGAGFKSLEYFPVWTAASQDFFSYPFFYTGDALPSVTKGHAAHSIYFQVLGEHGFVGLAIYLGILGLAFVRAGRIAKQARKLGAPSWIPTLATMLQSSIFAFCLGGAALSFAYFELTFAIFALIVVLETRLLPAAVPPLATNTKQALSRPTRG